MFHKDPEMFGPGFGGRRGPFGPGFGPAFSGFGPGFRAGRGMVELAILRVLSDKPMHGYEIISTLEEKSHGMWRPSAGSVYPTLQLLEEKGLIKSSEDDGKKTYTLTKEGVAENEKNADVHDIWEKRSENFRGFREAHQDVVEIMRNMRLIMHKGSVEQKETLKNALSVFRNTVEAIAEGTIS